MLIPAPRRIREPDKSHHTQNSDYTAVYQGWVARQQKVSTNFGTGGLGIESFILGIHKTNREVHIPTP